MSIAVAAVDAVVSAKETTHSCPFSVHFCHSGCALAVILSDGKWRCGLAANASICQQVSFSGSDDAKGSNGRSEGRCEEVGK